MLGQNLVSAFQSQKDVAVIGVTRNDLDLRDLEAVGELVAKIKPELVVHSAAMVGGIQANVNSPFEFLIDNVRMDSGVIQSCVVAGVENFLYLGSSCMYPKNYRQPLVESDIMAAPLEPTNEAYALAKIAGSKLCAYASNSFGLNYRTIVPSNLYGPGDNFSPFSSHLLASVIRKVHVAKHSGSENIEVWGSGSVRREFTYVGDLVDWVTSLQGNLAALPQVLNVGTGIDHTVDEYYKEAMKVIGYRVPLIHDLSKPDGNQAKLMDSSQARINYGWNPTTLLPEGIEKTYRWFLENQTTSARH